MTTIQCTTNRTVGLRFFQELEPFYTVLLSDKLPNNVYAHDGHSVVAFF